MKLHIHSSNSRDREELRTLLIDAATELLGEGHHILEPELPWDGHPILAADASGQPILISFEPENSQAALINGLAGVEQLSAALPWINQVYDSLNNQQLPPRLVIISSEAPPGTTAILAGCPQLSLYTYKILRINGDTGIWLERLTGAISAVTEVGENSTTQRQVADTRPAVAKAVNLPELSDEENGYFQQL